MLGKLSTKFHYKSTVWSLSMRLFITGATGYIGFNVAKTFRREGYEVWGLTSSKENIETLARHEIIPIAGSLQKPESFHRAASKSDVLIHTAIDYQDNPAALDLQTTKILLDAARNSDPPKTLVYTSGTWVLGNSRYQRLTEESPLKPIQEVAWRPQVEEIVLEANGIVIRPGVVYGKSGGMTGAWFKEASNGGVVQVVGDGQNHWAMVHIDDLGKGYFQAVQSDLRREIFNLVDSSSATIMEMASAAAQAAGDIKQLEFIPVDKATQKLGTMAEALAIDQTVDNSKAHRLLDWQPKHESFISEVEIYYRAWQASQSSKE
jgi:nucleoside-diphosphate-sugar epimerase